MKTIPVNPTKWPQKQKRFLALIATVAISDRATFVAILELLRLLQKIWSRIERNQMSDTPKCPFCGSKAHDGDSGWFKCGTIHISEGNFAGTHYCKNLAEFREPLDEKIDQLERELNAANERIKQLESDSYKSTQKIQRLEGWNTQNCADKVNLMETIRHRESWIERLIEAGDILARYAENGPYSKFQLNQSDEKKVRIENWESAKKR